MQNLKQIQKRLGKASEGPWLNAGHRDSTKGTLITSDSFDPVAPYRHLMFVHDLSDNIGPNNADFVVHARQDIPYLLAEIENKDDMIEALEGEVVLLQAQLKGASDDIIEALGCDIEMTAEIVKWRNDLYSVSMKVRTASLETGNHKTAKLAKRAFIAMCNRLGIDKNRIEFINKGIDDRIFTMDKG